MCGIAGLIGGSFTIPIRENILHKMCQRMAHRGPDDHGVWIDKKSQTAGLAHTRLSIIDLSDCAHQPMSDSSNRYTIVFNGEIYNYRQLRTDLSAKGIQFKSNSDTEVILQLYIQEGVQCVQKLRGMFAFAIWDAQERVGFLARDPFGIKPLYYQSEGSQLLFASEFRVLLEANLTSRKLSESALYSYLITGSVPSPLTLDEQVYQLPPGHYLKWTTSGLELQTYWSPVFPKEQSLIGSAVPSVRRSLLDSVEHHFVSDVPVAICLSGGLDSTSLLTLSHIVGKKNVHTFSIGFDDRTINEAHLAQRTASHFQSQHTAWIIKDSEIAPLAQGFLESIDQPSIDGLNTYLISHLIKLNQIKVALSGIGGDELFGSYGSFRAIPKLLRFSHLINGVLPLSESLGSTLENLATKPKSRRLVEFLTKSPTIESAYSAVRGIFTSTEATKICSMFGKHQIQDNKTLALDSVQHCTPHLKDQVSVMELTRYMRNQLLRDSDVMSMKHGVELRLPFLDIPLFNVLRDIPSSIRLTPDKKLLKDAIPEIPDWIMQQPKRGFVLPYANWFKKGLNVDLRDTAAGVPLQNWYQKWSIYVLEKFINQTGLS